MMKRCVSIRHSVQESSRDIYLNWEIEDEGRSGTSYENTFI